ncbi:MAG: Uncharacterised protein [Rhodobiaceae bacterium UBA7378]|nr:MAG: Uncharacterised protein [Rhodobiaceae bacterium UBA7378]
MRARTILLSSLLLSSLLSSLLLSSLALSGGARAAAAPGFYVSVGAILESDFDFAGNVNEQDEEGSGNLLALGYRWSDLLSGEIVYTDANDYRNVQFGSSEVNMWEAAALIHIPALLDRQTHIDMSYGGDFAPYLRLGAYRAEFREDWTAGIRSSSSDGLLWGVGVDYEVRPGGIVRLDYTPGSIDGDTLDRLTLGLVVHFSD